MDLEIAGISLHFHFSGAVYWRENKSLLLADLHLGKESVFQQSGIAIPSGSTASTLRSLQSLVATWRPDRVFVLGDLLHAKVGLTTDLERQLVSLIHNGGCSEWVLIPGNHDRGGLKALQNCGWQITADRLIVDGVNLMHAPESLGMDKPLAISGHLHPSIRVSLSAREKKTLRCYWLQGMQLVLPAFGGWTGTKPISRVEGDRVFACAGEDVIELTH